MSMMAGLFKKFLGEEPAPPAEDGAGERFTPETAAAVGAALHLHALAGKDGDVAPDVVAAICGALHCHFSALRPPRAPAPPPSAVSAWTLAGKIKLMDGRCLLQERRR